MAVIRSLTEKELDRASAHTEAEATFSLINLDGEKFIQIDTYGSQDRVHLGKTSQSLRLSKSAFDQLVQIAEKHF
ncbi:UNVERIFIED_ORG: hypothetical protein M2348_001905 [Sphingomonas sp. R1F5B]